jgi:hypothetical protein
MSRSRLKFGKIIAAFSFLLALALVSVALAGEVKLITKDELKASLGSPGLVIIDVRIPKNWNESDQKIKGAVREEPGQLDELVKKYNKTNDIVFYCA